MADLQPSGNGMAEAPADDDGNGAAAADAKDSSPLITLESEPSGYSTNYTSSTTANAPSSRNSFRPLSKNRHWKNLFGLATAFMVTFTAYGSLQNLQSSLNYDHGLGLVSLCVLYGCLTVSCLIAPVIIRCIGTKWTVTISLGCYMFYTAANFYPEFYTLIPTAALLGFAAGPLWAAQGTYLTTLAISLADVVNDVPETVINQFNGIFFLFFQSNQIWGNLLSSVIFSMNTTSERYLNQTDLWKCGRNGTGTEGRNYDDPGDKKTYLLLAFFLFFGLLGAVIAAIFMDRIRSNFERLPETKYFANHLLEVVRLMKTPYISLLIPLMVYIGFEQAYMAGDFTKSFVSCTIGIRRVGYVMIVYGVTDAISSFVIGRVEVHIGRKLIFTAGGFVNLLVILWMLLWRAKEGVNQGYQLYLMAVGWGFADAVWTTQISSILGVLMPQSQEAAFANFRVWQSIGFLVSFGVSVSNSVLVLYKLFALLGLLVISMILYYIMECVIRREVTNT
ncbi:protein unc-93 homolog A-like [Amphiura filiformis]|uniref:protein unc-93 homolog A-like n=1 Tax=Amphiura filiformis TaxID=82378 RepID=UPI003B226AA7